MIHEGSKICVPRELSDRLGEFSWGIWGGKEAPYQLSFGYIAAAYGKRFGF
jgi:hypothetical protein